MEGNFLNCNSENMCDAEFVLLCHLILAWYQHLINSVNPGRCGGNFKISFFFQIYIQDILEYLL